MKIKNLLLSLILIVISVFSLSACGDKTPADTTPKNWFTEEMLTPYGLNNLPIPTATNFENENQDSSYLLYLTAKVDNQTTFEHYVLTLVNYFNQNHPNTFGYRDGYSSVVPGTTYTANRITKSLSIYSYNTAGNTESVYDIYYTPSALSNDTCFAQYEGYVKRVKLWDGNSTFKLSLKYYAQETNGFSANTIVINLTKPDASTIRYYSLFDDAIVN